MWTKLFFGGATPSLSSATYTTICSEPVCWTPSSNFFVWQGWSVDPTNNIKTSSHDVPTNPLFQILDSGPYFGDTRQEARHCRAWFQNVVQAKAGVVQRWKHVPEWWIHVLCQVRMIHYATETDPGAAGPPIPGFPCTTYTTPQKYVAYLSCRKSFCSLKKYFARNIFLFCASSKERNLSFSTVPSTCSGKIGAPRTMRLKTLRRTQKRSKYHPKTLICALFERFSVVGPWILSLRLSVKPPQQSKDCFVSLDKTFSHKIVCWTALCWPMRDIHDMHDTHTTS